MSILECKNNIANKLCERAKTEFPDCSLTTEEIVTMFEYPPDSSMGDLALPCFKLAKSLHMAPPVIASKLGEGLCSDEIDEVTVQGGYLNIKLSAKWLGTTLLCDILSKGKDYGRLTVGEGKTAVFDYSSPNVAKPFHVGHLGSTAIGHCLKLIHEFAGYKTISINHLGDWGTQFGKLIVAYNLWGDRDKIEKGGIDELVALYVRFHKEAEEKPEMEDEARAEFTKMEAGDKDNLALWQWFIDISIAEYKKTYDQLGVEFDYYTGESFYSDKIPEILDLLASHNLTKIDRGQTIVDLEEYGMPPCLILKSDGSTLYAARDLAASYYRHRTFNFDKCVYVTSAGQSLHFAQWFKVDEMLGNDWAKGLVHVPYGTVSIDGGKLATRTGNVVLLKDIFARATEKVRAIMAEKNPDLAESDEVAEAVGVGAIVFHYLSNSRIKDINFVIDDVLSFEGNTGPYAQYTYARCCSILEKSGEQKANYNYTPLPEEKALLLTLSRFPEVVGEALNSYEPMVITRYALDICAAFNRFYHDLRIASAENEDEKAFRVALTRATKEVLGSALHLICLKTPKKI